jgi:nitroreductase
MDLAICADHMAFQALHEGLGTCFYSTYREEEIREILTVPYSMRVPLLLMIGYSAENSKKPKDRLPLSRIVSFEHW